MAKVEFPAVLILARVDRKAGKVIALKDNKILGSDQDLAARMEVYRALEEAGGIPYSLQLVELARADQGLEERRAELEIEAGLRPAPRLDPLATVYTIAQVTYAGNAGQLERLDRALDLVRAGAVVPLGGGQYKVSGYRVNSRCECADHRFRGVSWCKHRLAVALVKRAAQLENGAKGAATPKAPEASEETQPQAQHTTDPDLAQVKTFSQAWGAQGVDLQLFDGRHVKRLDLALVDLEPKAREAGWKESRPGSGFWMNPAHDWDGEQERRLAEWTRKLAAASSEQVKRDLALPAEHSRGRAKLYK